MLVSKDLLRREMGKHCGMFKIETSVCLNSGGSANFQRVLLQAAANQEGGLEKQTRRYVCIFRRLMMLPIKISSWLEATGIYI